MSTVYGIEAVVRGTAFFMLPELNSSGNSILGLRPGLEEVNKSCEPKYWPIPMLATWENMI